MVASTGEPLRAQTNLIAPAKYCVGTIQAKNNYTKRLVITSVTHGKDILCPLCSVGWCITLLWDNLYAGHRWILGTHDSPLLPLVLTQAGVFVREHFKKEREWRAEGKREQWALFRMDLLFLITFINHQTCPPAHLCGSACPSVIIHLLRHWAKSTSSSNKQQGTVEGLESNASLPQLSHQDGIHL